jgi:hypothetical protein
MGLTTHFFNQFQLNSHKVRITTTTIEIRLNHGDKNNRNLGMDIQKVTTFHTKTQHGSNIYRVLGLHRRHSSVHEFSTGFRVRDKESTQRSIAELNEIHEGWVMVERTTFCEGFLHCVQVIKCRCRGKMVQIPPIPVNSGGG